MVGRGGRGGGGGGMLPDSLKPRCVSLSEGFGGGGGGGGGGGLA